MAATSLHVTEQIPMPSSAARLAHPKAGLSQVTLHRSLTVQRTLYAAVFVLGHALAVSYCVSTAGEPYRAALAQGGGGPKL